MIKIDSLAVSDISDSVSEHNVHDEYKSLTIPERRTICASDALPYEVVILNVTGELNVGNIIRSASLCGATRVRVLGRRKYDKRGTVGAENYIDVIRETFVSENDPLKLQCDNIFTYFEENNLFPIFVEQYDNLCLKVTNDNLDLVLHSIQDHGYTPIVVFGNENRGIPFELIAMYMQPYVWELNQRGVIRSFNVGSTAAIVLYKIMETFLLRRVL